MKRIISIGVFVILLGIFSIAAYQLVTYFLAAKEVQDNFVELALKTERAETDEERLAALNELAKENPDMIGWVKIDDTSIDYPVMHTSDDGEYYLRRDFEKNYSKYGTPFLDAKCDWRKPSANLIIYGHNMKAGVMFRPLEGYESEDFYKAHKVVKFDTLEEIGQYEIFAVIKSNTTQAAFIYNFIDVDSVADFNKNIEKILDMSLYDTGIVPRYSDEILTLSTCEYSGKEGRLIVVAKKIK